MTAGLLVLATALWLGVLTSISPCPLATNVAATSVLARRVGSRRRAMAGAAAFPVSAALFFGALLPLAMTHALPPLPVVLYGLGTALPVGVLAILLVLSVERAGSMMARSG